MWYISTRHAKPYSTRLALHNSIQEELISADLLPKEEKVPQSNKILLVYAEFIFVIALITCIPVT